MDTSKLCEVFIRVKPYLSIRHLSCSPMKNRQEWRVSPSPTPVCKQRATSPNLIKKGSGESKERRRNQKAEYFDYDAIKIVDKNRIVIDTPALEGYSPNRKFKKNYTFDNILAKNASNKTIYESLIQPKLSGQFEGMSFTVIAYGISGSGKTHTIFGSTKQEGKYEKGLLLQTIYDLFDIKNSCSNGSAVEIKISMLEIYNEHVHDQLDETNTKDFRNKNLQLIENPISNGVIVQDQSSITVRTAKELISTISKGQNKRAIGTGSNNQASSRSHVITEIQILSADKNDSESKMLSKVRFVDLAGSEKQIVCEDKELINEGSNINKSLLALTNCITVLADEKKREQSFIPYRNSKLTRILKDSLSGNTPLVMTVCITSNSLFIEETINSLHYAEKAMAIKAGYSNMNPSSYKYNDSKHSEIYRSKIKEMERQINFLKGVISKGNNNVDNSKRPIVNTNLDSNEQSNNTTFDAVPENFDKELLKITEKRKVLLVKKSAIEKQLRYSSQLSNEALGIDTNDDDFNKTLSEYAELSMKKNAKVQTISKLDKLINMCDDRIGKLQIILKKSYGPNCEDPVEARRHSKLMYELKDAADILEKNQDLKEDEQIRLAEIEGQIVIKKSQVSQFYSKGKKEDGNKKNQRQVKKYELKLEILNAQEQGFFMKHRIDNVERANLELLDKVFDKEKTIENQNKVVETKKESANMSLVSTVNTNEHGSSTLATENTIKIVKNDLSFNINNFSKEQHSLSNKNLNTQKNCKKRAKNKQNSFKVTK